MITIERNTIKKAQNMLIDHTHESNELYFLISGGRRYFIGHYIYDITPGNVVIVPKNELHRTAIVGSKGYDRYLVMFDDQDVSDLIEDIGYSNYKKLISGGCFGLSTEKTALIKETLEKADGECKHKDKYYNAYIRQYLREVLLTVLRYGKVKATADSDAAVKIQAAAQYISENFTAEISLTDAAEVACMEATYFSKRFKKLTGFGFTEYLNGIRLREAKRLLKHTDLQIGKISEMCGFSCSNYFGDAFRRQTGISPTEYRTKTKPML